MINRPNLEQSSRLALLGAATIFEAQGQFGSIDAAVAAVDPSMRLVGPALTVGCGPSDNLMLHAVLEHAQPGDVIVADARGYLGAGAWGDVLTVAAQKMGVAGLILDGAIRDATDIIALGFPVFARGLSIRGTTKTYRGTIGEPVQIGGVRVHTGDIVVGDRDGLVVIPAEQLSRSLELAEARAVKEEQFRQAIAAGATTVELLGLRSIVDELRPAPAVSASAHSQIAR